MHQLPAHPRLAAGAHLPSTVKARGAHALWQLPTADRYTVVIDETGNDFAAQANHKGLRGRFVCVAYPTHLPPPPRAGFHAVKSTPGAIDAVVQTLLDHPTAVLGVSVDGLPATPGNRWRSGVLELIEWVLRLVPVDRPTQVTIQVEQRYDNLPGDRWQSAADALRRNLADRDPERAAHFHGLTIELVGKDHPHLAYADALAHTWGTAIAEKQSSIARLAQSDLAPQLLDHPAERRREYDLLQALSHLPAAAWGPGVEVWWGWLGHPSAADEHTIFAHGLRNVAAVLAHRPELWPALLARVHTQLEGLELNLRHAGAALGWLQAHRPEGTELPPRQAFLWALAQRIDDAHHGRLDRDAIEAELARLRAQLFDEDARLICLSDLYLAVAATNAFDFQGGRARLAQWLEAPMALPGRRLYGRVLSSLGQHEAFEGRQAGALKYFDAAIEVFNGLTDANDRARERIQTQAYRAIVLMDVFPSQGTPSTAILQAATEAVEAVLGPLLPTAERLNASAHPKDRYAQHLIWRLAATGQFPALTQALVDGREAWQTGQGHPWPLIEFYRAAALHPIDAKAAAQRAAQAVDLALTPQSGPTLNLIGVAIAVASRALDVELPDLEIWLTYLDASLPHAAETLGTLRAQQTQTSPPDPNQALRAALPFNFR